MKKIIALVLTLALMAAAVAAVAEDAAPAQTPETETAETQVTETAAAADEAQAAAEALSEALAAWQNARAETRRQAILDNLKQELDACVTAGTLTQEQADLILKYYTEQMTLNQNGPKNGFSRGGKNGFNGRNLPNGQNGFSFGGKNVPGGQNFPNSQNGSQNGFNFGGQNLPNGQNVPQNGFGFGGRHGRFGNMPGTPDGTTGATPGASAPAGN